jgi:hypothetical protein
VGAAETHGDAVMEEEDVGGGIIKFMPVIALNTLDGATELSFNIGKEIQQSSKGVRFKVKWKGLKVV